MIFYLVQLHNEPTPECLDGDYSESDTQLGFTINYIYT